MSIHTADIDNNRTSTSTGKSDWIAFKKTKLLMTPRPRVADYVFRFGVFFTLFYQSNGYLAAGWLLVSIAIDLLIVKQQRLYNQQVTNLKAMAGNTSILSRYKFYWYLNCAWFGITSFVFAGQHAFESQMVMVALLNLLSLLYVAKTSANAKLSYRIIFVIIFSQLVGILWNIFHILEYVTPIYYIYIVYLLVKYLVLLRLSKIFCKYMLRNFELQFDNKNLIDSLSAKSALLDQERKIAITANETIQRFYSNAAHDVRQPVYALQMYASMLHDDSTLGDVLLPKIQLSCIGINSLFNSLFDFQQLRLGTIDYKPKKININQLLQDLNIQFAPLAAKKNLSIKFKPISGNVFIDDILIKRILGNFIVNAVRYTNKGGILVVVRHSHRHKELRFEVWDTGRGIADENQLKIFNEFFKVPDQKVETDEGFGLGLSIVKQLAQLVAGSNVTVHSRLNRGSVFKFSVPDSLHSASWVRMKQSLGSRLE